MKQFYRCMEGTHNFRVGQYNRLFGAFCQWTSVSHTWLRLVKLRLNLCERCSFKAQIMVLSVPCSKIVQNKTMHSSTHDSGSIGVCWSKVNCFSVLRKKTEQNTSMFFNVFSVRKYFDDALSRERTTRYLGLTFLPGRPAFVSRKVHPHDDFLNWFSERVRLVSWCVI